MRKMRIVIDVTSLIEVVFVSGIQRVVREITTRMVARRSNEDTQFILIAYGIRKLGFYTIPVQKFLDCYQRKVLHSSALSSGDIFSFDELGPGDVFFDIDSVWNNRMRRSFLLPILKNQGVSIAVHVYDIIPILYPQYCDEQTTFRFMDYIGAHLLYADLIIANTESTLRDIKKLAGQLGVETLARRECVPLGADFVQVGENTRVDAISSEVLALEGSRYLLMVGTIEPRKNYSFILDAYEAVLRAEGFKLVIAGRSGWNIDLLMSRIHNLCRTDDHFLYLDQANDATINYLYEHAFFTVFPTLYEGFGLPIIESFLHRTPVLASDISVLREVGGDFCDYFTSNDKDDLFHILMRYKNDQSLYQARRSRLEQYIPVSWDQSEDLLWNALQRLRKE